MADPQQIVWDDEKDKAAPAAPSSANGIKWDDQKTGATPAQPATQRVDNAPRVPSGTDWLMHPFNSARQSVDIASQYYGAKGDKDESIAKGVGKSLGRTATMIPSAINHPYDALVGGNIELMNRSREEAAQGKTPESMLHSVAAGVPLFGPMAVSIGERLGGTREAAPTKSDIAGGLTDLGTAIYLSRSPAGKAAGEVADNVTGSGPSVGETVRGVRKFVNSPKETLNAAADVGKAAAVGAVEDTPVIGGAIKAVRAAKKAQVARAESAARAADFAHAAEQSELARNPGEVPQNYDVGSEGSLRVHPEGHGEAIIPGAGRGGATARFNLPPEEVARIRGPQPEVSDAEVGDFMKKINAQKPETFEGNQRTAPRQPNIAAPAEKPVSGGMAEWKAPEFEEIKSGVKRVGRAGESPEAQYKAAKSGKPDAESLGQFARVNGPRIDAAVPSTPEGQTLANHLHDIKGPELEKVANDLKVDIGDIEKTGKKGTTINREAIFNRLLDAGHTPEDIVNSHLNRFGNPPSVSGGAPDIGNANLNLDQVRQRLNDPNVRAQARIGNMMMEDKAVTGERVPSRIGSLNDLADQARRTSSPEELAELDRMGQNQYAEAKDNIANTYRAADQTAARPNIAARAEAPSDVKVWRDQPGEQHPVKIVYDEHGQPTAETDGRHRVIQALKNGYDRIEVTVDRGNGPQKTTVPVRALARQMGVDEASLANTDSQQSYRAGGGKPRIAVTKQ
jgi:hypothetical protein